MHNQARKFPFIARGVEIEKSWGGGVPQAGELKLSWEGRKSIQTIDCLVIAISHEMGHGCN